jgi:hypothetical protein
MYIHDLAGVQLAMRAGLLDEYKYARGLILNEEFAAHFRVDVGDYSMNSDGILPRGLRRRKFLHLAGMRQESQWRSCSGCGNARAQNRQHDGSREVRFSTAVRNHGRKDRPKARYLNWTIGGFREKIRFLAEAPEANGYTLNA